MVWEFEKGQTSVSVYLVPESELQEGDYRLLETDNPLIVPVKLISAF